MTQRDTWGSTSIRLQRSRIFRARAHGLVRRASARSPLPQVARAFRGTQLQPGAKEGGAGVWVGGPRRGVFSPLLRSSDEERESPTQREAPSPQLALHLAQVVRPGLPRAVGSKPRLCFLPGSLSLWMPPTPPVKPRPTTLPSHLLPGGLSTALGQSALASGLCPCSVTLGHCSGFLP